MSDIDINPAIIDALEAGTPAVKAFRQGSGETFSGLARAAGIGTERLGEIEAGSTPFGWEAAAIAIALGVDESDLIAALE